MKKNLLTLLSLLMVASMVLAACGGGATTAAPTAVPTTAPIPTAVPAPTGKVCEVTDTGGVDDKGFNQTAYEGAKMAAAELGWEATFLESKQQTDYDKNIKEFIDGKCDLIVTVGFLLGDATKAAAEANPNVKFQILDFAYDPVIPNVWAHVYATNEGSFLAGYLAAGMSKTGIVGTFGGINIPPVADFMVGFQEGVEYYNSQKGADVKLLGWDNAKKDGLFAGNFTSLDDGKRLAENLMDEGADVIFPVAGPVGLGSAAAIKERGGGVMMIGVDTDQYVSAPEFKDIMLSSVLKHLELSVLDASKAVAGDTFKGGTYVGNLQNGGVGLAPFHDFDSAVPQALKDELKKAEQDIVGGKIRVSTFASLAAAPAPATVGQICEVTDTGGVDDKGFNQTAFLGAQMAAEQFGGEAKFLESKQQTDYDKNIKEFIDAKCDLIVTVGFLLGDATKAAAEANPDQKFQILDFAYDPIITNVWGQVYATNEASFLAGYLAAGMSKTGKVGTFGGINIPPVADFMVGFQEGVEYYNSENDAQVAVLGWDNAKKDGLFAGNFTSLDDGKRLAENLMDEGADVIFPVAGPVGLGSAAAIKERGGGVMMIGVDTDQYVSAAEFKDIMLSSVLKHLELSVVDATKAISEGSFKGGTYVGNLANGGVGLAPFHDFDSAVPQEIKDDLAQIQKDIIDGKIVVNTFATLK
jgi:basic membrane protein A